MNAAASEELSLLRTYLQLQKVVLSGIDKKQFRHTKTQFIILTVLALRGPLYMSQIAQYISSSNEQATRAVAPLADEGLVERTIHPDNRKHVYVSLSEQGREYVDETLSEVHSSAQKAILNALDPEEAEKMKDAMNVILEALSKIV